MQLINDRVESNVLILSIEDMKSLNGSSPEEFRQKLQDTLAVHADVRGVVLDMSNVDYITSTAIATLVLLRKSVISKSRKLVIAGMHEDVRNALSIVRLDKLLESATDVPAAIAAIASE